MKLFIECLNNKEEILKIENIEESLPRVFRKLVFTVTEHFYQYSICHFNEYMLLLEEMFESLEQYDLVISDVLILFLLFIDISTSNSISQYYQVNVEE